MNLLRARFHLLESRQPARIVRLKMELRLPVIIRRAQEAVHRGADMAGAFFVQPALPVAVGDPHPLGVPALQVAGDHARSRLQHLADRAAAFLGFAEAAAELIGEPGMLRPVMPAERLVMRPTVRGDLLDGVVSHNYSVTGCECAVMHAESQCTLVQEPKATPSAPRVAQPVMRCSIATETMYMPTPIRPVTIRPAKASGTSKRDEATSIR